MTTNIEIPWDRYALIAELAARLEGRSHQFGKTVLEKMVFLLQELHGVRAGYEFSLYTYGPFSSGLLSDLDYVDSLGGVSVGYAGFGGYVISPGAENQSVRRRGDAFLAQAGGAIASVVDQFGRLSAKDLELRSTIVYVDRDVRRAGRILTREDLVHLVRQIKPHFSEQTVREALAELEIRGDLVFQRDFVRKCPTDARRGGGGSDRPRSSGTEFCR